MKKFAALALALVMAFSLVGCGSKSTAAKSNSSTASSSDGWTWDHNIEIVCPWGAGGGADTTLRTFATALEKEIGVKVVVNNKEGAGGTTGVSYAEQQPADGYTWLLCTQSPLLAQLTGASTTDVKSGITPVCQLVHDTNVIVTGKDSPYSTFEELQAYIKKNPGKVKCGCMSITGLDGLCAKQAFSGDVEAVAYTEGAQLNSDVMSGHIALAVVGPAEIAPMIESGDVKPILVCSEKRMSMSGFKNCECAGDLKIDCYQGPYRGIFCAKGTPKAAVKAFEAAAKKAVASNDFQKWAKSQGLDQRQGWLGMKAFAKEWNGDITNLQKLVSTMKE